MTGEKRARKKVKKFSICRHPPLGGKMPLIRSVFTTPRGKKKGELSDLAELKGGE